MKKQENQIQDKHLTHKLRIFNENIILIDPNIDASEKEIYARNGYRFVGKNLRAFGSLGTMPSYQKEVFVPSHIGKLSK